MRRAGIRRLRIVARLAALALASAAGAAAACVEIAAGPGGVASLRLEPLPLPPSIVIGDALRDSMGDTLRLRATAFDANGAPVADAPFRFVFVPISRDTARRDNKAIVVDSLTGLVVAAPPPFVAAQGRVGVQLGGDLTLLDTIDIVPRPRLLRRGTAPNGDSARTLAFSCLDAVTAPLFNQALSDTQAVNAGLTKGTTIGNFTTLATTLIGDSLANDSVRVRRYLVRYQILSPTKIPTVQPERGGPRPAIGIVDGGVDNPINYDTTSSAGNADPRLRIYAPGLNRTDFPSDTIPVTVRAFAIRSRTDTVASPIQFVVRLVRVTRSTADASPVACP